MRRYQTKRGPEQSFEEAGPDLLRTREHALDHVGKWLPKLRPRVRYLGRRIAANGHAYPWREIGGRHHALEWLEDALAVIGDRAVAQLAREPKGHGRGGPEVVAVCRAREITVPDLDNATPAVEIANALYATAFPSSLFAGAFVCKQISGTGDWSDHAWGDALDRTEGPSAPNDAMTDWAARMAAGGDLTAAQILGSSNGRVVEARWRIIGAWRLLPSSASSSHLWHNHLSCREHTGVPPCAR